jgi:hypothetical protein
MSTSTPAYAHGEFVLMNQFPVSPLKPVTTKIAAALISGPSIGTRYSVPAISARRIE